MAVVGAGRGPLVSRALRAAQAAGRTIVLFAIEKNPNAYVHLLRHNRDTWQGQVTIIKSDMRTWNPPFSVDILISELLGSFGDNELSPECLDGVQRVLNRMLHLFPMQSFSAAILYLSFHALASDWAPKMEVIAERANVSSPSL